MSPEARRKVAVLGVSPPDVLAALAQEVELIDTTTLRTLSQADRSAITHGVTSAMGGASPEVLDSLPGLNTIASVGAGLDRFDLDDLTARGVQVHPTPQVMTEDTAECAVGLIFALLRNIVKNDLFVRAGEWAESRAPLGRRISGRRVGIVGLGRIGNRVAARLDALGCEIYYTGRAEKDVPWRFEADVGALAQSVEVLVLCVAGGKDTRGLVDAEVLRRLGPSGFLVNVSRGSVVDEEALIAALDQSLIAGAALDVFENEPTPDLRFLGVPNCILQPHAAVYTHENRRDLIAEIRRLLGL